MPSASTDDAVSTTASEYVASLEIFAVRRTPDAAPIIWQKPSNAEAAPACFPNGESVCAVPSGFTIPMPSKKTHTLQRNGKKLGQMIDVVRIATPPATVASRPRQIDRSSPSCDASCLANMPAANTIKTVPAKNKPSSIGVKCMASIRMRGVAEKTEKSPPMIRLTVAAGTMKRRSRSSPA